MPRMNLICVKSNDYILHFSRDGQKTLCGADVSKVVIEAFPTDKSGLLKMIDGLHPHAWICGRCEGMAAKEENDAAALADY